MRSTRSIEISTGMFVLLGFAALFFLVTQITNRELSIDGSNYMLEARFEISAASRSERRSRCPASPSGGSSRSSSTSPSTRRSCSSRSTRCTTAFPSDSDASIMTSGLLGAQYIGITAGGAEDYLKDGSQITLVQDAMVLENLINQLAASFGGRQRRVIHDTVAPGDRGKEMIDRRTLLGGTALAAFAFGPGLAAPRPLLPMTPRSVPMSW